jgi:hypothetical protein
MVDAGTYRLVTRGIAMLSLLMTMGGAAILSLVIPPIVAAIIAIIVVGPSVHLAVGTMMQRRPDRWGDFGSGIIVTGITYPLLLWIGGTIYVAVTRSLALAAVTFLGPLVLLVAAVLLWNPDRGLRRRAERERQAFAAEHGWQFVADGTEVLHEHWGFGPGAPREVTASAVLSGSIDGWPVTICTTVDHHKGSDTNPTVVVLVHLPVSLPRTIALPYAGPKYDKFAQGPPWQSTPVQGYTPSVEDLLIASADPAFGTAVVTPEVRRATVEGDLMFWRIARRDLSLARRAAALKALDEVLRTASRLVALARALPADALAEHGTAPLRPLPFAEPAS